jgi:hypothetical protein
LFEILDYIHKLNFVRFYYKEFVKNVVEMENHNQSKEWLNIENLRKKNYLLLVFVGYHLVVYMFSFSHFQQYNQLQLHRMYYHDLDQSNIFLHKEKYFFKWMKESNYLLLIDHEDQDRIEMDFHVEDLLVIRFDLIDLPYFLIWKLIVIQ